MSIFRIGLVALVCVALALGYYQQDAIQCQMLDNQHFVMVADNVYVDANISPVQASLIEQQYRKGKVRVERLFGITNSQPTIVATNDRSLAQRFGVQADAHTIISPLGQCIVIGPNGQSTDVFAHELVHAELAHRLGYLSQLADMPAWFGEGLALAVDNRELYRRANMRLSLADVARVKQHFYHSEMDAEDKATANYQAAKVAVAQILSKVEAKTLYRRLERIRTGKSFDDMFGI